MSAEEPWEAEANKVLQHGSNITRKVHRGSGIAHGLGSAPNMWREGGAMLNMLRVSTHNGNNA